MASKASNTSHASCTVRSTDELAAELTKCGRAVVVFSASWCKNCPVAKERVRQAATTCGVRFLVAEDLEDDDLDELAQVGVSVEKFPTTVAFEGMTAVRKWVGSGVDITEYYTAE